MELENDCAYVAVGFTRSGIRQHIIDVMNEWRRNVRNGYDYETKTKVTAIFFYRMWLSAISCKINSINHEKLAEQQLRLDDVYTQIASTPKVVESATLTPDKDVNSHPDLNRETEDMNIT